MHKYCLFFAILSFSALSAAQFSESRSFTDFSIIKVQSGINVYISQSDTFSVEIIAERSSIHRIVVEQFNNTLRIHSKDNYRWSKDEPCEVHIRMPEIVAITAERGSDVYCKNTLQGDVVFLKASGGSDIYVTIQCNTIKTTAASGGSITLKGNGENISAKALEGGNVWAKGFKAAYANVNANAGSQIEVQVSHYLDAVSNGGDIRYRGSPAKKSIKESGSGDVKTF